MHAVLNITHVDLADLGWRSSLLELLAVAVQNIFIFICRIWSLSVWNYLIRSVEFVRDLKMARSILSYPAVKIFIRMLGEDDILSTLDPKGLVWLEGRLVNVDKSKEIAVLFDTTGKARIDYSSVKKLRSQPDNLFSVDTCVMVVGKVESYPPDPLIKAVKVSPISEDEVGQVMWEMEVEEQHMEVYRKRFLNKRPLGLLLPGDIP